MARRLLVLRHHTSDALGLLAPAFATRGFVAEVLTTQDEMTLPSVTEVDAVVVLGSTWSVYDERIGPWFAAEVAWLQEVLAIGTPVLGVCFGAQTLSVALGGTVERSSRPEYGWHEIVATDVALPTGPWFQYHGDRCLPPDTAAVLGRSETCIQAFRLGSALAVQFHPEVDDQVLRAWLDAGEDQELLDHGIDLPALLDETRAREAAARINAERLVALLLDD